MPEFDRQSGQRRAWHLIAFLREAGWSVTFVSQYGSLRDPYARSLQQAGVETLAAPTPELFRERLKQRSFELALLLYWKTAEHYLPLLREVSPATRVVVDSVDLHFVRNARRQLRRSPNQTTPLLGPEFGLETARELNVYAAADAVLTVSENEADLLNGLILDGAFAHMVPDADDFERSQVPRQSRRGILCLSNFAWDPNIEAFAYLCERIAPLIDPRILASEPIQVVGNALDQRIRNYASSLQHKELVGWVPSVVPYLENACISVVPLLHGAGTKRKLLQALMVGTPTVTTSVGAEGLNVVDGEHVLVADGPAEFASAIERLVTDAVLWEKLATRGRDLIARAHGKEIVRAQFMQVLTSVTTRTYPEVAQLGTDDSNDSPLSPIASASAASRVA
jgi:glycosyltransferase involved in cell wall biosynthesis